MQTTISKSPTVDEARKRCLKWFTGKAYENASHAFDLLAASEAEGCWLPGSSRKVAACLSKANVAIKLGKANRRALEALGTYSDPADERGWEVGFLLNFSDWRRKDLNWTAIKAKTENPFLHQVIDQAHAFVTHFGSIRRLVKRLDTTRPKPVFTSIGASPTVSALLASLGLISPEANVRVCPIRWERKEKLNAEGKVIGYDLVGYLEWPAGTRHNRSKYALGGGDNRQCHACGHAIKNPFNWVPLVIDNVNGHDAKTPYSLIVGKDCAKTIFGIKVTGDFEIEGLMGELGRVQ